jgi:hypothetical protein
VFDAKRNAVDAINQKLPKGNQPFKLTVTEPALMVGPRGKVMPMLSGSFRTLTVLDEKSKPVSVIGFTGDSLGTYRDWRFTNPMGYSGSNTALAIHPHSVGKKVRSCASCHLSPKTLGLGSGDLSIGKRSSGGRDRMKPLDRSHVVKGISKLAPQTKVTVRGKAVAGTSQPGARPFNQGEITRILKVGNCISCHDRYDDLIYRDIEKSYKLEKTAKHRNLRKKFFK